tara:strand:- start:304 stop:1083 length:780 start_codon:yes stop_codon:yes gene_type:complete
MSTLKTYYTHDNGGRPFKVVIDDKKVYVYKYKKYDADTNTFLYSEKPIKYEKKNHFKCINIFIGKSPKNPRTIYSSGYGSKFTGNSILLQITENKYVFIGDKIFSFISKSEIKKFTSPVGNNDVPYPYAVDVDGKYYLMIEDVIINKITNIKKYDNDPYDFYYKNSTLIDSQKPTDSNILNIKEFYIGDEQYNYSYNPSPSSDFDRISSWDDYGNGMKIVFMDGSEELLTKKKYVQLNKKLGKHFGFSKLTKKMIQKRL